MFHAIILVCESECVCMRASVCIANYGMEKKKKTTTTTTMTTHSGVAGGGGGGGGKVDVILAILSIRCKIKHFDNIYVLFLSGFVCVCLYACMLAGISTRI